MFRFFKGIFKDGKILAITDLAIENLEKGNTKLAQEYFEDLAKYPLKDLQTAYFENIKFVTKVGDINEILEATSLPLPDNAIELITLVWKDDVSEIMALMHNDTSTFIGTFASLVVALNDSAKKLKAK